MAGTGRKAGDSALDENNQKREICFKKLQGKVDVPFHRALSDSHPFRYLPDGQILLSA